MAGQSNDDHAKALEAFSAGAAEPHTDEAADQQHLEAPTKRQATPAAQPAFSRRPAAPVDSAAPVTASPVKVERQSPKQIELKRTIIPLMLTLGTLLPLAGLISILMGEESLIGEGLMLPVSMIVLGLLILGAGVVTMLQVKHLLAQSAR